MKALVFNATSVGSAAVCAVLMAGQSCLAASYSSSVVVDSSGDSVVIVNGQVVSGGHSTVTASGPARSEERKMPAYSGITIEAPVRMSYTVGERSTLKVTAPSDVLPLLSTTLEGGRLVVKLNGSVVMNQPILIEATGSSGLESVNLVGAGDFNASGLAGRTLSIEVSGSGNVTASGRSGRVEARISGSGEVDVSALQANAVSVEVSGSGNVKAYASQAAQVALLGSGDVRVYGKPAQRSVSRVGSGQVSFD
ncbi:DUF2807 domain-containing protein [Crenobacter sp. SG2305]|uniref:GIN domain-containing protein n=1 Tax=Crenobacter oryzisoli TaxID=3056844 RepID=UPI0025AAC19D|nr:DUF2807 domain-containing protein [Crenobacter sp. SG2305]MDN0083484.1 DUF2807 domain-containing protein [Crenobacter sp. SG2305]